MLLIYNLGSLSGSHPVCQASSFTEHFPGNCSSAGTAQLSSFLLFPSLSYFWLQIPPTYLCPGKIFWYLESSCCLIFFCQEHCPDLGLLLTASHGQTPAEACWSTQVDSRTCTGSNAPFGSQSEDENFSVLPETVGGKVRGTSAPHKSFCYSEGTAGAQNICCFRGVYTDT